MFTDTFSLLTECSFCAARLYKSRASICDVLQTINYLKVAAAMQAYRPPEVHDFIYHRYSVQNIRTALHGTGSSVRYRNIADEMQGQYLAMNIANEILAHLRKE